MSGGLAGCFSLVAAAAIASDAAASVAWPLESLTSQLTLEEAIDMLGGTGVNIYRAPMNGRNFEYFGEDPWLGSRLQLPP